MRVGSLFSGGGGLDLGLELSGMETIWQVENNQFALQILTRHWPKVPKHMDILTFCVEAGHVKIIQSQVAEKAMREKEVVSGQSIEELQNYSDLAGLSQRMSQDYSLLTAGKISAKSLKTSIRSGIVWRGQFWIPKISAFLNNVKGLSLLEALETSVPQKYYLSPKAVLGIIRRAQRDGRSARVLMQEVVKGTTRKLSWLSLLLSEHPKVGKGYKATLPIRLRLDNGVLKDDQDRVITLRKLTPVEKERLQGFPMNWTHPEGLSLVMPLQSMSQNGLDKE